MPSSNGLRLFIAIDLPDALSDRLLAAQTNIPGATWVKRQALHLTLRFLGDDIDKAATDSLIAALKTIRQASFPIRLSGVGRFPPNDRRAARVLWVGLEHQPALRHLADAVESKVVGEGFPPEARKFSPHITLARLKDHRDTAGAVERFLKQHQGFSAEPFNADSFILYSSTLTPGGSIYQALARLPLSANQPEG